MFAGIHGDYDETLPVGSKLENAYLTPLLFGLNNGPYYDPHDHDLLSEYLLPDDFYVYLNSGNSLNIHQIAEYIPNMMRLSYPRNFSMPDINSNTEYTKMIRDLQGYKNAPKCKEGYNDGSCLSYCSDELKLVLKRLGVKGYGSMNKYQMCKILELAGPQVSIDYPFVSWQPELIYELLVPYVQLGYRGMENDSFLSFVEYLNNIERTTSATPEHKEILKSIMEELVKLNKKIKPDGDNHPPSDENIKLIQEFKQKLNNININNVKEILELITSFQTSINKTEPKTEPESEPNP